VPEGAGLDDYDVNIVVTHDDTIITDKLILTVSEESKESKKRTELLIARAIIFDEVLKPGSFTEVLVNLENHGRRDLDDVSLTISVPDLGIRMNRNIDEIDGGEEKTYIMPLDIPIFAETGFYPVKISAQNDDERRIMYRFIEII